MLHGEKISKGIIAVLLTVSMVLPVHATSIQENEQKRQELEGQKQEAQSEVNALKAELNDVVAEMRATEQAMASKEKDIETTEEELVAAKISERTQAQRMKTRIKYMYENGSISVIEVFLTSENMTDFVNKAEYVALVSEYDRNMLDDFKQTVKEVQEKEEKLQKDYEKLGTLQAQLSEKQTKVETLLQKESAKLESLRANISDLDTLIANAKEAERRRKEAAAAKKQQQSTANSKPGKPVVIGNGYFTHPCPGMSYQSSYFGEVRYGIGDTTPHKGNDYAASRGTPIYAAAAGTVVIAGYSNSAGNWVVIDHGNGLTTKYMHMYARPLVSAGDKVSKGQHIGGVGTTGQSTGNHLHFQVEEYGVAVNPAKYM